MRRQQIVWSALAIASALTNIHCNGGGGGSDSPTAPPPPPNQVIISIVDNAFSPQSPVVSPGTTVRWVMDGMDPTHTTTAMDGTWDSGFVFNAQGNFYQRTFPVSESGQTFQYFCITHQATDAMQGSIRVGNNAPDPPDGY
jgi:plastocyanin